MLLTLKPKTKVFARTTTGEEFIFNVHSVEGEVVYVTDLTTVVPDHANSQLMLVPSCMGIDTIKTKVMINPGNILMATTDLPDEMVTSHIKHTSGLELNTSKIQTL